MNPNNDYTAKTMKYDSAQKARDLPAASRCNVLKSAQSSKSYRN